MTTMDIRPRVLDFADDTGDQLRHAANQYWFELGWHTTVHGSQLVLELDDDLWGLQMPAGLAVELVAVLRAARLSCPVIDLGDQQSVVLIESTERQESAPTFAWPAGLLPSGHRVALPPSVTEHGPVRWLTPHEPDSSRRPGVRVVAEALARLT
jgi:hypothetical protein